ncbi:MAG: SDR family oxidoreductase [Nitrososphaerota archaeon]|jgi:gluconate 5-dehydrogenase|nr:SDR family oxidoreductase [Nitrososphaerota archaeon]MDG6924016.1 SDR family oxidoreductase [Nitrososphaerota archaeon]
MKNEKTTQYDEYLFSLNDKVVLVTGAAWGGIGSAASIALARFGATVICCDLPARKSDVRLTLEKINEISEKSSELFFDVTDESAVRKSVECVAARYRSIDVLLNCAGITYRKESLSTSSKSFRDVIDVNVVGTWLVSNYCARLLMAKKSKTTSIQRKIVNLSSVYAAAVGSIPQASYYTSKAAIANLTRALAAEWGPLGINVNCVAPGAIYPTGMTKNLSTRVLSNLRRRTFLNRLGEPLRDLIGPIVFLSSKASDYVTGQVIYVDGGRSALV